MVSALLLEHDNFTPMVRTPWGGRRIARRKAALGVDPSRAVGESWEIAVGPPFPTRVKGRGEGLGEVLARDPIAYLGAEARAGRPSTALLLKWLDAGERLSLQIHPTDDDPGLQPDESGKPEAWYVVESAPGAGIFLGFREGVTERDVRAAVSGDGDVESLLRFVPVTPGDFFVVEPGTPHAIGEGVFVVEPQQVLPGKEGVTYRYWNWGRKYDAEGRLSPTGTERPLQVERALAVTRWDASGDAWFRSVCLETGAPGVTGRLTSRPLAGEGGLAWSAMDVHVLMGTGALELPRPDTLLGVTVLEGRLVMALPGEAPLTVMQGQSAVVPAEATRVLAEGEGVHAIVASIRVP